TSPAPGAPIIYLDGGPGGSGVGVAQTPTFGPLFRALRAHVDVILLSQRGTGLSDRIGCRGGDPLPSDTLTSVERLIAETSLRHSAGAASVARQGRALPCYTTGE